MLSFYIIMQQLSSFIQFHNNRTIEFDMIMNGTAHIITFILYYIQGNMFVCVLQYAAGNDCQQDNNMTLDDDCYDEAFPTNRRIH
mmetsp:Transcript_21571/g.29697  ORF Transcript_21571/g.29697 Transcript_21571/m.29697 type:complete len:85 (-) Transcript_21571:3750-4004(-)